MEAPFYLFPCTRMHDLMRAWNDDPETVGVFPEDIEFEEVEIASIHPDITFNDFLRLTQNKIVWMGPDIFVESLDGEYIHEVLSDFCEWFGYGRPLFYVCPATSVGNDAQLQVCSRSVTDATISICAYVFQLMTRSNTIWAELEINALPSIPPLALSHFLNNSRSTGGKICFGDQHLSNLSPDHLRDYLRVLEISTGPHHQITIERNTKWSHFLTVTLANFLQHCPCAIALECYYFRVPSLIIDALRGDCNILKLYLGRVPDIDGLVQALAENKSLVSLYFTDIRISDDIWTELCHSLSRHPKLESLNLDRTFPCELPDQHSNERRTRRTNIFLQMLQTNTVLQQLDAQSGARHHNDEFDDGVLADVIRPYFRHLRHVRDFDNYRGPLHAQVLARALYKVNDSPALVWKLIRNNLSTILGFEEDN